MPGVAAAASWMEALSMPLREMRKRFTKSELAIMGWRSAETAHNMRTGSQHPPASSGSTPGPTAQLPGNSGYAVSDDVLSALEQKLGPVAYKLENDKGDVDLRRLTGNEAMHYFAAMGIPIGGRV